MSSFLQSSVFFGVFVSVFSYFLGMALQKKFKLAILNPLLISIVITILFLFVFKVDYKDYNSGAQYISYLLTPATVSLAIPLYEQFELLKKNVVAVIAGITSGVIASLLCVLVFALLFGFNHTEYVSFLPKSITTAIGMGVSEELDGYIAITVAVIVLTGILGNVLADFTFKLFRIKEPIAKGIALGTSSHAIGTSKAMEIGEAEGAMSSLSIVVAGVLTVIGASLFANII